MPSTSYVVQAYQDSMPVNAMTRWSNKENKRIKILCRALVQASNKHMGVWILGILLLDCTALDYDQRSGNSASSFILSI
jgi:hypothetical protein